MGTSPSFGQDNNLPSIPSFELHYKSHIFDTNSLENEEFMHNNAMAPCQGI